MTWVAKFRYTRLKLDSVTVAKLWCGCEQRHNPQPVTNSCPHCPHSPHPNDQKAYSGPEPRAQNRLLSVLTSSSQPHEVHNDNSSSTHFSAPTATWDRMGALRSRKPPPTAPITMVTKA